jgi:hypothetical protein
MPEILMDLRKWRSHSPWLFRNKHMQPVEEALTQARINIFKDEVLSALKGGDSLTEDQIRILALSTDATIHIRKDGKINVNGIFNCSGLGLTDLCGLRFGKVKGRFNCSYNSITNLEGFPIEGNPEVYFSKNQGISDDALYLICKAMIKNQMDYWSALCVVKSEIDSKEWAKLSKGLDTSLNNEVQKGLGMLGRFGLFE